MNPKPLDLDLKKIIEEVEEIFDRYNYRDDIIRGLEDLGFALWGYTKKPNGSDNLDEEIWAYDRGTPNGQILVLINWIDCFAWVFEKKKVINL